MRRPEETTALITGATDGLGRSVATELARRGARVLVHGRNPKRGAETIAAIRAQTGSDRVALHLAGFLLTESLLGLLRASGPSRVVNVSSLGQAPIDFDDPLLRRDYDGVQAYCQSKLAQVMHAIDLSESGPSGELTANSLHPATYMPTKIVLSERGSSRDSLELGTRATLRLAIGPELEGVSGRFFDRLSESSAHPQAYDPEARARLRELSEELVAS